MIEWTLSLALPVLVAGPICQYAIFKIQMQFYANPALRLPQPRRPFLYYRGFWVPERPGRFNTGATDSSILVHSAAARLDHILLPFVCVNFSQTILSC